MFIIKRRVRTIIQWVTLFSIAMGLLESAVVVYLRELYYPEGFDFPLSLMSNHIALTELFREAATIIMLMSIGVLAGRTRFERFAYFIYSFAIWDIFYYIFLKLLLGWPESFLTWDILFLIPTTWVGPVITPILLSLAMIGLASAIIYFTSRNKFTRIIQPEWWLFIGGSVIVIISFVYEYVGYLLKFFPFHQVIIPRSNVIDVATDFVPKDFPWWIFWSGFGLILSGIFFFVKRNKRLLKINRSGIFPRN